MIIKMFEVATYNIFKYNEHNEYLLLVKEVKRSQEEVKSKLIVKFVSNFKINLQIDEIINLDLKKILD